MAVFRPDAHPEVTCLDGWFVGGGGGETTWADTRTGLLGDINAADGTYTTQLAIKSDSQNSKWAWLRRGVVGFDTSTIPDDITIISATLSLRGADKDDALGITPNVNVYSVAITDNTNLIGSDAQMLTDWRAFGSTAFSTAISYASFNITGWNDFILNANGIAHISKIGITNFGIRNANYDASGIAPSWSADDDAYLTWWNADYSDGSYAPRLTVTYTTSTMKAGNFAVVETRLHYVGTDSVERYIPGTIIGDAVNAPGNVAVVEERIQYVGATSNKERYWLGTLIGDATNPRGSIAVVESRIQYVDTSSKERYIKGVPV